MPAPFGNKNASKGREWAAAINRALTNRGLGNRVKALDDLAEKLLRACDAGDMGALKELGDRLDGKPAQTIDLDATVRGVVSADPITPEEWLDRHATSMGTTARPAESAD